MQTREIEAKSILRKHRRIDSWFVSHYGMNLYRGCTHNCAYCDGRAERYNVQGEFGREVAVKVNAAEVLERELDPGRKRKPLRRSFIMVGGGVGDAYQPADRMYRLSRRALEIIRRRGLPVHVLTKSTAVLEDMDLLGPAPDRDRAVVSFSFSSVDDRLSALFEPGVPPPSKRLEAMARLKEAGIACGFFLMPVIPLVTDSAEALEAALAAARGAGTDFVLFSGMTLKQGRQTDHFLRVLGSRFPDRVSRVAALYGRDRWGGADGEYTAGLHRTLAAAAARFPVPLRMPPGLWADLLDENDRVIVMLDHLDYLLRLEGKPSPYGHAARSVARLEAPLSAMKPDIRSLGGVGPVVEKLILEMLDAGRCGYYERLLLGRVR